MPMMLRHSNTGRRGPSGESFNRGVDDSEAEKRPRPEKKPAKKKPVYVRKEFPETWLWTEKMVE